MELVPSRLRKASRFVFAGRFGSGKTEIAINFALQWARQAEKEAPGSRPILIDLDLVTPYFRSREVAGRVQEYGLDVVAPAAVSQYLDTPALTPAILGALQQTEHPVILDVGGDEQGARALALYSDVLRQQGYVMYFVVNPYRPFTGDPEGIRQAIAQIERASRLLVTGLVSNPNLIASTTVAQFLEGQRVLELASRQLGLPIAFTAIERGLLKRLSKLIPADMPVLPLERFFVMPWAE